MIKQGDKVFTSRYSAQYVVRECIVLRVSPTFVYCKVDNTIVWIHRDDVFLSHSAAEDDVYAKLREARNSAKRRIARIDKLIKGGKPPLIKTRT